MNLEPCMRKQESWVYKFLKCTRVRVPAVWHTKSAHVLHAVRTWRLRTEC
jgi:hypothetical protein